MGICVERLPHKCGTMKGLQVFQAEDGSYNGYCYTCDTVVPDPYQDKPKGYKPQVKLKTQEEIQEEIKEIHTEYGTVDLPERRLKKEYL